VDNVDGVRIVDLPDGLEEFGWGLVKISGDRLGDAEDANGDVKGLEEFKNRIVLGVGFLEDLNVIKILWMLHLT